MENNIDSSRLNNDPELKPLLSKGASLLACLCFAHWIRGFEPTDVGLFFKLSEEEVEINIAHIKQLLPSEILASQIQIRDEIKAIQKRSEERKREWSKSSALSVEELMMQGQNPGHVLRRLREEISEDFSSQVEVLRSREGATNIHTQADDGSLENDLSPEKESQPVPKLRQEETNTSIQHIKALVQEQMAALNIREKNEICASKERPKKAYEELTANEENINDIRSIRKESIRASVKEEADGLAQEQVCQVIAMLREQEKKPATATMPERGTKSEYPCPEQNWQTPNDLEEKLRKKEQKPHVTKTDRRITFRLDPVLLEKVQQYSQNTGIELSMIVRQALTQLLEADVTSKETANAELPQSALSLTGKYQVWGSDLREELWMQFLRTLAAAYVTTRRWHRDERSHRLYEGLIRLYRKLEGNNVRQI